MSRSGDRHSDDAERAPTSPADRNPGSSPLVIVSEQGRHSQASRRIVRAQAARASAAQSRVTRARNRDQRQTGMRESPLSPPYPAQSSSTSPHATTFSVSPSAQDRVHDNRPDPSPPKPLNMWLSSLLNQPVATVATNDPALRSPNLAARLGSDGPSLQLPPALTRGFSGLQQRVEISDAMLALLSRAACVDFASPGFEQRLNQLLFDLVSTPSRVPGPTGQWSGHPVENHLRLAATCLTIFQGQHAMGNAYDSRARYQDGLQAAWFEAMALDSPVLVEPKLAEVSLWIIIVISVTTQQTADVWNAILRDLLRDLQLTQWDQVRRVLLEFIYPVSILDEPCRHFYLRLSGTHGGAP